MQKPANMGEVSSATMGYVADVLSQPQRAIESTKHIIEHELEPLRIMLEHWHKDPVVHRARYEAMVAARQPQLMDDYAFVQLYPDAGALEAFYQFMSRVHHTVYRTKQTVRLVYQTPQQPSCGGDCTAATSQEDAACDIKQQQQQQEEELEAKEEEKMPELEEEEKQVTVSEMWEAARAELMDHYKVARNSVQLAQQNFQRAYRALVADAREAMWNNTSKNKFCNQPTYQACVDAMEEEKSLLRRHASSCNIPWYKEALVQLAEYIDKLCIFCLEPMDYGRDGALLPCRLANGPGLAPQPPLYQLLPVDQQLHHNAQATREVHHPFHYACLRKHTMQQQLEHARQTAIHQTLFNTSSPSARLEQVAQEAGAEAIVQLERCLRSQVCPQHFRPRTIIVRS